MKALLSLLVAFFAYTATAAAQGCCSGGSCSPIAGGTSQGVLAEGQAEIATSFQYTSSRKFLNGDKPVMNFLSSYTTSYSYTRLAYGVTKHFTISLEAGYFLDKTQVGLNKSFRETNSGISDLVIFPRYTVYSNNTDNTRDEITVGLGYKFPLGKYLDSFVVYKDPATGKEYYTPQAPAVMPTTGSNDFIFYGFAYRGYPKKNFRLFTSLLYIRKGWNPLGQKFGDYASIGIFAGKTIFNNIGLTLQLKEEWIDVMKYDHKIDMLAVYNLDANSTGGNRLLIVPQINYNYKSFSIYALSEFPIYQYVNGTAIASQYLTTIGLAYRFNAH